MAWLAARTPRELPREMTQAFPTALAGPKSDHSCPAGLSSLRPLAVQPHTPSKVAGRPLVATDLPSNPHTHSQAPVQCLPQQL